MDSGYIFKIICGIVTVIMIIYYCRRDKKLFSFFVGAFTGSAALFIVNKYGSIIGMNIPLNLFNISGSVILGAPFVLFLVIMNFL
ncbi:MAG: pro-sigmaK processing inhibitor BofA family protein [Ruminococcus sp.]|uniref:pro-sigmaK processing inhibitor BofA family protein n=1 Tax=Ruminococcus sp. TaxID=41978 RepID=UPI0025F97E2D|nr:pro-sigmaK processing inhibitor BofA family protein [Ruminococcus sp.]MBR5682623.1 pro-sigmaK processing inhibitor BofA family protein [Ruminococcus sp.]